VSFIVIERERGRLRWRESTTEGEKEAWEGRERRISVVNIAVH
jgi:hypothetical protein